MFFLANAHTADDVTTAIASFNTTWRRRAFCFEFDPKLWATLQPGNAFAAVVAQLHAAGLRTLTATPTQFEPSVAEQVRLYQQGIDIVYTYNTPNGVTARDQINKARGLSSKD